MQLFFKKNIFLFFWVVAFSDIIAVGSNISQVHALLKLFLIPILIGAVLFKPTALKSKALVLSGLLFSFSGDIFLLGNEKEPLFFITGLICFLVTHIFYSLYFIRISRNGISLLAQKPYLIIIVVIYTSGLLYFLFPKLGSLKLPVIAYACVLSMMLLSSMHAFNFAKPCSKKLFVQGAACFVISDSILAINKFHTSFSYAGCAIMFTYCLAQYFITKGFIKNGI